MTVDRTVVKIHRCVFFSHRYSYSIRSAYYRQVTISATSSRRLESTSSCSLRKTHRDAWRKKEGERNTGPCWNTRRWQWIECDRIAFKRVLIENTKSPTFWATIPRTASYIWLFAQRPLSFIREIYIIFATTMARGLCHHLIS